MTMYNPGDVVSWTSLNGTYTGVVESTKGGYIIVRLDGGKCIVADEKSLNHAKQ